MVASRLISVLDSLVPTLVIMRSVMCAMSPAVTPAQIFVGDTVFASTEITGKRDFPGRPDLGIVETILRGHKFVPKRRCVGQDGDLLS